jgi:hypothetical protein
LTFNQTGDILTIEAGGRLKIRILDPQICVCAVSGNLSCLLCVEMRGKRCGKEENMREVNAGVWKDGRKYGKQKKEGLF